MNMIRNLKNSYKDNNDYYWNLPIHNYKGRRTNNHSEVKNIWLEKVILKIFQIS